jgi:hypothetical protein
MKKIFTALFIALFINAYAQVTLPTQPKMGPGGSDAEIHTAFDSAFYGDKIENQFWLFEPKNPKPSNAPVVVYWHGSYTGKAHELGAVLALDMFEYVKRGYIVVAPLYEHGSYEPSASKKIELFGSITKAAFSELEKPGHIIPLKDDKNNIVYGCVGYSLGGIVFAGASNHQKLGIHPPAAIVGILPFGHPEHTPYSGIPTSTKVALVAGDSDFLKDEAEKLHWPALSHIPCENKIYALVPNNAGLNADHLFPLRISIDALDYFAAWKFSFGMMDCAIKNKNCEYVLTNKDSITYMGKLSTGRALRPIIIKDGACNALTNTDNNSMHKQNSIIRLVGNNSLEIENNVSSSYKVKFFNTQGVELSVYDSNNQNKISIEIGNLPSGIYLSKIISNDYIDAIKFIKE